VGAVLPRAERGVTGRQAIIVIDLPHGHDDAEVIAELRAELAALAFTVVDVSIDPGPPVPYRRPT